MKLPRDQSTGEAHAETGPELRRAHFESSVTTAGGVPQQVSDEHAAAPGAMVLDWSLGLDDASLTTGLVVEKLEPGSGWTALPPDQAVMVTEEAEGDLGRVVAMAVAGWQASTSYRVRIKPELRDILGRTFGKTESLEWRVPDPPADASEPLPPIAFDKKIPLRFESWEAASNPLGGRFPGGQNSLFQGLYTDSLTGLSYARARWFDARNGSWLSEDPMDAVDSSNLYAFVGWQPAMGTDPRGEESLGEFTERYAVDAYAGDSALKKVAAFGLQLFHATVQVASAGAVGKIDQAQEALDRGEIDRREYWKRSGAAVGQAAASYAVGGAAGAAGGRLAGAAIGGTRAAGIVGRAVVGAASGAAGGLGSLAGSDVVAIATDTQAGFSPARDYLSAAAVGGATGAAAGAAARQVVPQGLTRTQFQQVAARVRAVSGELGLGDDLIVHGSRAAGRAIPTSDIDIAIRVDQQTFDRFLRQRFGTPNLGSAKEKTMLRAIDTGKIQAGEAGLRSLRRQIESMLGLAQLRRFSWENPGESGI